MSTNVARWRAFDKAERGAIHHALRMTARFAGDYNYTGLADEVWLTFTEDAWRGVYPGMCVDPEICRGYSHCPRDYSCSE